MEEKQQVNILQPWLSLDPWQKQYIEQEGNCFLLCGRQVGKTTAMSIKGGRRAALKPNRTILMIALTERQAYNLFSKTLAYLRANHNGLIKAGKDRPTKHEIKLKNGSLIMCHPTGLTGDGLRTFTLTDIFIDEASRLSDEVFTAVTPMMAVTGGSIDVASTPCGKQGYFYECSKRDDFNKFYVSAEDCPRHKKEFLEAEKRSKTSMQYSQEYLAVFLDEMRRLYPDRLLKDVVVMKRRDKYVKGRYYIGVDVGSLGEDASSFEILDRINKERFEQVESIITTRTLTTATVQEILRLDNIYNFKTIGIDNAGLGVAVFHPLLKEENTKRKTIGLSNAQKNLDRKGEKKAALLKEDMYMEMLSLMEKGQLFLLDDDELIASLKSVQFEYVQTEGRPSRMRVFSPEHEDSHIVEGLVRAVWVASADKRLNIWCK